MENVFTLHVLFNFDTPIKFIITIHFWTRVTTKIVGNKISIDLFAVSSVGTILCGTYLGLSMAV